MIVREHPSTSKLFFIIQGSVVPHILGKIISISLLTVIVLLLDLYVIH